MSIRNKVNVVNSVQYHASLRRLMNEGKDETSAGIFSSGNHAWITNGDKLLILDTEKGCLRPVYSFGEDSKDPVDITCIEELVLDCSSSMPLLLVGTSSLYCSQLCVFNPAHSRVIRAIQLENLQVRCISVVEDGRSSLNSLTDMLSAMEGVVALGCADGSLVLVDLNRQTIIKAYQGNLLYRSCESTPQPIKFVSMADEETTIVEINEARQIGASSAIMLIEGDDSDSEFGVTALSFSRETACLYVGYSSGLWQIWNLSFSNFTMMYECAECTNPVSNFCQIEPCEDPRPTVYLWVNHEGTDSSMPLLNMYTLSYASKIHVNDFGVYYQDFISCSLSFTMYPGEGFSNVASGRLVSAKAYSKTIKRHLIQNMGLPALEGIQMKLVATTFSLTFAKGSTHTYLCIFDLDQWYKEQMPHEPTCDAPYIETSELISEPLLASAVLADSISLYHTEEPQEIHLVPQALSFRVVGLSENGVMTIEKIGLQKLWLANMEAIGAKSLIHPTKLFHACVSSGFVPMFPAHQNQETSAPTNEEMRSYIMSVCLDNGLINVILEIGEQWESGLNATSNCTLSFLFDWVWSSVSSVYKSVNSICDTLFSASGQELDVSLKRRLQLTRLILDRLHYLHTAFCSKYNHALYADSLEPRLKAIDIITLFVHQVTWFVNVGLLPEASSKDLPKSAIRYDYFKLDRFAIDRRQRLNSLYTRFKRAGKAHELPGAGLYLVDHFVHDYNELGQQWEDEGGSTAYPPPSLQSLLRSIRIPTVPTATKLALIQYTLLDIMNVIDKAKHEELVSKVGTFHLLPKINATQTKVVNGLWHLDHSFYEEGLRYLFDRTITVSDLSESLHRAILRMLLFEGKEKLAIQYLRLKNPPLSLPDDLKLEMSLLLANKLTSEAYHFQRGHSYLRKTLLHQLFTGCLTNGEIVKLIRFPLDETEINLLHSHLAKNRCQRNDDLRVSLLIGRSKFHEAKDLHEKLLASSTDRDELRSSTRAMIVNGFANTLCPTSRELYLQKIDPNLKNHPAFKSSKPRPLSVYVKTIDDGGFPNFAMSNQELCAAAVACSANLKRFTDPKSGKSGFNDIINEEPMICCEENTSLWCKQDSDVLAPGKRAGTWVSGANKRRRMDEDATAKDDGIAAFVGTPLVKRRSRELADPATPLSMTKRQPVHSILKSGKTPGTPGRTVQGIDDDMETPKKTLRWDIPTAEGGKAAVKKSLLSTSLLTPSKDPPLKASHPEQDDSIQTPQGSDSIKNRLRSHTPSSVNKKDVAIWNEIAEEAKAKVLFSLNLPPRKEKKQLPSKPVGPSFVVQVNQLIKEEEIRKENEKKKEMEQDAQPLEEFPTVSSVDQDNARMAGDEQTKYPENEDVEMQDAKPSPSRAKRLKFLDLTIGSDEVSLLDVSGSPFTTTAIPREFRQQLKAKLSSPHDQAKPTTTVKESEMELDKVQDTTGAQLTESITNTQLTPKKVTSSVKKSSKTLFAESSFTEPGKEGVGVTVDEPLKESPTKKSGSELPIINVCGPDTNEEPPTEDALSSPPSLAPDLLAVPTPEVQFSVNSLPVEDSNTKYVTDVSHKDDELPKMNESVTTETGKSLSQDESKNISPKDISLNAFTTQPTPQIGSVVSLSRSHYAEDEDEVGSEDPEEAEIPPVIEFSQPEEGLVIDTSYTLKNDSDRTNELEENNEVPDNELEEIARVVEDKQDDDSGSSVICLDSDSDRERKNETQLDYEDYGEDSYSADSEEAEQSSRGRRSFFHDKYNTHQEESDESPSPEYSSGDDEKRESDVDLYNMDDMEENDGMPKDEELDDEIFAMGKGIQERKDLDASSEEDDEEEEDIDEEEDLDEDDNEEDGEEEAEIIPVTTVSSHLSPLARRSSEVNNDIQEVLSSDEEHASFAKIDSNPQLNQESESGSNSFDVKEAESFKDEEMLSTDNSVNKQIMKDEDQLAVDNLLGLSDSPIEETSPEKSEEKTEEPSPSKAADVIDILNLSQGQMFFGSPEAQICDKPPNRALFQLGTSPFTPKSSTSGNNKSLKKVNEVEPKPQNEAASSSVMKSDISKSEETLVLRLEESDIVRAGSPQQSDIPENGGTFLMNDPQQEITTKSPSNDCVASSNGTSVEGTASPNLDFRDAEAAPSQLETVSSHCEKATLEHHCSSNETFGQATTGEEPACQQTEKPEFRETCPDLVPVTKIGNEQIIAPECDSLLETDQTSTKERIETTFGIVESNITVNLASDPTVLQSGSPGHPVSESPIKHQAQNVSFGCQVDASEVVEELKSNLPKEKESIVCQTTFIKSSPSHVSSKSFSCQAAMDTTSYANTTIPDPNDESSNKLKQHSLTSKGYEALEPEQGSVSAFQESTSANPPVTTTETITELSNRTLTEDNNSLSRKTIGEPNLRVTKLVDYEETITESVATSGVVADSSTEGFQPSDALPNSLVEVREPIKTLKDGPSDDAIKIIDNKAADTIANSPSVQITLEPPMPFKTLEGRPPLEGIPSNDAKTVDNLEANEISKGLPTSDDTPNSPPVQIVLEPTTPSNALVEKPVEEIPSNATKTVDNLEANEISKGLPTSDDTPNSPSVLIVFEPPTPFKTLVDKPVEDIPSNATKTVDNLEAVINKGSPTSGDIAKSPADQILLEPHTPFKTLEDGPPLEVISSNVAKIVDNLEGDISKGLPTSDDIAKSPTDQIVLEPPTPFKTVKDGSPVRDEQDVKLEDSDLGVKKLDETSEAEEITADEVAPNPCDVAFIEETSFGSLSATPKTPGKMTPLRKSLRISRMSTPGRALAPDSEVNVSDSILDVAMVDPEVTEVKPLLVDRSMITDYHGPDRVIVPSKFKDAMEGDLKSKKSSDRISLEKPHKDSDSKKRISVPMERDLVTKKDRKSSQASSSEPKGSDKQTKSRQDKASSVDPERQSSRPKIDKERSKRRRSSSAQPETRNTEAEKPLPSEPKSGDRQKQSRQNRASSVDTENISSHRKKDDGSRHRRSSSAQPETRDSDTDKRKGRRSLVEQEVHRKQSKKVSVSKASSGSESGRASPDQDRARRHSSVEPESKSRRRDTRRASSEGPSSDLDRGSSRKRRGSMSVHSEEDSPSPSKQKRLGEPSGVSDEREYRKRKIRHSITEPLEKKKHQLEEQSQPSEPQLKVPRRSEPSVEDISMASSSSGPPRKSRSLNDFPVRRSVRPSVLASIQELPEDSPQPMSKTTMRASSGNLSALDSLMSNTQRIDISKWLALSSSQANRAKRLLRKTQPSSSSDREKESDDLDIGAFLKTLGTPVNEEPTSPTGSLASITSSASSKVLRSGRVIDENTPTRRPRESSSKKLAARSLRLSSQSPAKVLRSGRSIGEEEHVTAAPELESTLGLNSGTPLRSPIPSTSVSPADSDGHHHENLHLEDFMSSRRLTRHQRSVLETSKASTTKEMLSPNETPPPPEPKMKTKKHK